MCVDGSQDASSSYAQFRQRIAWLVISGFGDCVFLCYIHTAIAALQADVATQKSALDSLNVSAVESIPFCIYKVCSVPVPVCSACCTGYGTLHRVGGPSIVIVEDNDKYYYTLSVNSKQLSLN